MHMVSITGSKQVKELENELKENISEQSAKIEKHADTLMMVISENMNLKNQMQTLQEQNTKLQEEVESFNGKIIEIDALKEQLNILSDVVKILDDQRRELMTEDMKNKENELIAQGKRVFESWEASKRKKGHKN